MYVQSKFMLQKAGKLPVITRKYTHQKSWVFETEREALLQWKKVTFKLCVVNLCRLLRKDEYVDKTYVPHHIAVLHSCNRRCHTKVCQVFRINYNFLLECTWNLTWILYCISFLAVEFVQFSLYLAVLQHCSCKVNLTQNKRPRSSCLMHNCIPPGSLMYN